MPDVTRHISSWVPTFSGGLAWVATRSVKPIFMISRYLSLEIISLPVSVCVLFYHTYYHGGNYLLTIRLYLNTSEIFYITYR